MLGMSIAKEISALRAALQEDRATFAARWSKSARTIEAWEQGRRAPEPFILQHIRALAKATKSRPTRTA